MAHLKALQIKLVVRPPNLVRLKQIQPQKLLLNLKNSFVIVFLTKISPIHSAIFYINYLTKKENVLDLAYLLFTIIVAIMLIFRFKV